MTDVIPPSEQPASETSPTETPPTETPHETTTLSDLDKIKAAQAARRSRRTRTSTPTLPTPPPVVPDPSSNPDATPAENDPQLQSLRDQVSTLRLEMASLRRNHLTNLKKITDDRDMFAAALAREQSDSNKPGADDSKRASEMGAQLRAARTRNNDLEEENATLRDDVKQLNFRLQAGKTLAAANDGYERIVDDLVAVKLKCAQLQEEKEDLLKINRELTQNNAVLSDSNGELEKSRSTWVVQCAELEKQRAELENKLKVLDGTKKEGVNADTSYTGSDLQNIKLN